MAPLLARAGISPLWIVDKEYLDVENVTRNYLCAEDLGQPKALALAARLNRELPWCRAEGIDEDFLEMTEAEQPRLVARADVVVAATDEAACQRPVNAICVAAGAPAVFPAVWVDPGRVRHAEVGEILWMVPGSGPRSPPVVGRLATSAGCRSGGHRRTRKQCRVVKPGG